MSIYLTDEFREFVTESIPVGQKWFSNENRKHVYKYDPNYYSTLNFEDDQVFLQPLMMSYFLTEQKEVRLEQLIFRQIMESNEAVPVLSDKNGNIYLEGVGHFPNQTPNKEFLVKKEGETLVLFDNEKRVDQELVPIMVVPKTSIELPLFELPYVRNGMTYPDEVKESIEFDSISTMHYGKVLDACGIIEKVYPQFFEWLKMTIRSFQIIEQPEVWSFASIATFGISYFSASEERSLLFFLEDIIHQSSHNVFYAVNYFSKEELFSIPPSSAMNDFMNDGDMRNIYGVFHGLFTQTNINIFFNSCLDQQLFSGEGEHELMGRLSDNMKRWKLSLDKFGSSGILSEVGEQYYDEFKSVYEQIYAKWGSQIDSFDTSNQPYIFNYQKFTALNPLK